MVYDLDASPRSSNYRSSQITVDHSPTSTSISAMTNCSVVLGVSVERNVVLGRKKPGSRSA